MAECEGALRSSHGGATVPQEFLDYQMVKNLGIQPSEIDSMAEWQYHLFHQFMLMEVRTDKILKKRNEQRDELAAILSS